MKKIHISFLTAIHGMVFLYIYGYGLVYRTPYHFVGKSFHTYWNAAWVVIAILMFIGAGLVWFDQSGVRLLKMVYTVLIIYSIGCLFSIYTSMPLKEAMLFSLNESFQLFYCTVIYGSVKAGSSKWTTG
jgi:hypothetical protein